MKRSILKNSFLKLSFSVVIVLGGIAACSNTAQNSSANNTPASSMPGMDHNNMASGGMMMNMNLGPADAEYDLRFIDAMMIHHQGAIEMAKEAEQKTKRSEIKKLAQDIIKAQKREGSEMQTWRKQWYPQVQSSPMAHHSQTGRTEPMSTEMKNSMGMMMDLGAADAQFDLRFINAMIPHHESAILMAKDALSKSKHSEIKQLAQNIITSQQAEINQMKQWRKSWYKQ